MKVVSFGTRLTYCVTKMHEKSHTNSRHRLESESLHEQDSKCGGQSRPAGGQFSLVIQTILPKKSLRFSRYLRLSNSWVPSCSKT
jgi:hypothetical protein